MSNPSDDIANLFVSEDSQSLTYSQGVILSWDVDTWENEVLWRDVVLENLPVLAGVSAFGYSTGDIVALVGWDAKGRRGASQWWILGELVIPGPTVDSTLSLGFISAETMNAGEMNADSLFVDGASLDSILDDETSDMKDDISKVQSDLVAFKNWTKTELDKKADGSSNTDPPPSTSPPNSTQTKTYSATWSAAYRGNGRRNTFDQRPHQGYWSSTNGNQRSLIGFNSSQIQSDHAGRTITRVRVYLYFAHWNRNSGGTAVIGHHGHNSAPSTFSANTDNVRSSSWPKPGGRWVTYSHSMQAWRTGTKRGIAIGPGPTTGALYYGRARGVGESRAPRLEIRSTA